MSHHQLVIIGSGPAGYTAAIYAARAKLAPTQFVGFKPGGQLMWTSDIENFPGFAEGKNGPQLMMEMQKQAERFGSKLVNEFITAVDFSQKPFKLWTNPPKEDFENLARQGVQAVSAATAEIKQNPPTHTADSVIITAGAVSRMLGVPGEMEYLGKGVSTCAVCDAAFYKDKDVAVIGGGDSAMEDTLALTKFAKSIKVLHRRNQFRASKIMQERVLNNPKVEVWWNTAVTKVEGNDQGLTQVTVQTTQNNQTQTKQLPLDGLFLAIGHIPMSQIFADQVALDAHGYILTRSSFSKAGLELAQQNINDKDLISFPSMTSVEGVFAAGDVVDVRYKQAITAAGQGCQAALDAERWLEK